MKLCHKHFSVIRVYALSRVQSTIGVFGILEEMNLYINFDKSDDWMAMRCAINLDMSWFEQQLATEWQQS